MRTILSLLVNRNVLMLGVVFSLFIMFLGSVIINLSTINEDELDDEDWADAQSKHQNGAIIYNLGVMFLLLLLFNIAIFNEDLHRNVRLGMLIAAGLIGFNLFGAGDQFFGS